MVPALLTQLRRSRDIAGHFADDPIKTATDKAIIELLDAGHTNIAAQLITPSGRESSRLKDALGETRLPDDRKRHLLEQVVTVQEQKQRAFLRAMSERSVHKELALDILSNVTDPESALSVTAASWQQFGELPDRYQRKLIFGSDPESLDAKLDAVILLNEYQIDDPTGDVQRFASRMPAEARHRYLSQLHQALGNTDQTPEYWSQLSRFQEPQQALELATALFPPEDQRSRPATELYYTLMGTSRTGRFPIRLDQEQLSFLQHARTAVEALHGPNGALIAMAASVMRSDNPPDRRTEYLRCLATLQEFPDGKFGLQALRGSEHPTAITRMWEKYGQRIADWQFRDQFLIDVWKAEDPESYAARLFDRVLPALAEQNAAVDKVNLKYVFELTRTPALANGGIEKFTEELTTELRIGAQIRSAVEGGMASAVESAKNISLAPIPEVPKPPAEKDIDPMSKFTELRSAMAKLGLPPAYINDLCASWMSFNGVIHYSRQKNKLVTEFTPEDISTAADYSVEAYLAQYRALKEYVDKFGAKELTEQTYKIFGTTNFMRMSAEQLHHQLERWQDPSEPVTNLQVTAKADNNGFFQEAGRQAFAQLGERGTFCFEAGSPYELARAAVRVGDRERAARRDPLQRPEPITVVVGAHGEPLSLALGFKRNRQMQVATKNGIPVNDNLRAADYVQAMSGRDRLEIASLMAHLKQFQEQGNDGQPSEEYFIDMNTFQRHLGRNFRLILKACLANAVPSTSDPWARNISQRMAAGHDTVVESSDHSIYGMSFEADGRTMFAILDSATKQQINVPAQIVRPNADKFDTAA
jgi:hypothetical protein